MASRPARSRPKKRGRRDPEPLGALLLRASPDDGAQGSATPIPPRAWQDAVGDRIAARTRPLRLERRVLTVRAATSVWAQELTFLAEAIVARLVALGFAVVGLRFQVGPVEPPSRQPKLPNVKTVPALQHLPRELSARIEQVEDGTLRAAIQRAAASNLAWQKALDRSVSPSASELRRAPLSAARRASRDLRSAAPESAPPARTSPPARATSRDKS